METESCPLCKSSAKKNGFADYQDVNRWLCPVCGEFLISMFHVETLNELPLMCRDDHLLAKLSAIIKERTLHKLPPVLLCINEKPKQCPCAYVATVDELLLEWPKSVPERMDRALLNLANLSPLVGQELYLVFHKAYPTFLALDAKEACSIANGLIEDGMLCGRGTVINVFYQGAITPAGWRRIHDLREKRRSPDAPVFVAMWFGDKDGEKAEMLKLYEEGIRPAVKACGYDVDRVDLVEHNEYIMNKIRDMIRVAPFVIADFTGHRHGVYLEFGLAMGRDTPVIACCKEEDFKNAHFDTQQFNHILWNEPGELTERLINRIRGTIGQGPHLVE